MRKAAHQTNILFSAEHFSMLKLLAGLKGITVSELVRRTVADALDLDSPNVEAEALASLNELMELNQRIVDVQKRVDKEFVCQRKPNSLTQHQSPKRKRHHDRSTDSDTKT